LSFRGADSDVVPYLCVARLYALDYDSNWTVAGRRLLDDETFEGEGCETAFVEYLTTRVPPDTICFSHNGAAFDHIFLIKSLFRLPVAPELLVNGTKFIQITLTNLKIRLIDSYSYVPFALRKFGALFGISVAKTWFPHKVVTLDNLYDEFDEHPAAYAFK
jgi:hypothetical protein